MMKTFKTIKINSETYAKLSFLKGWIGANENRFVGLDEAIVKSVDALCQQDQRFARALTAATSETAEVEYAA